MEKRLYRNEHDKVVAGVCSGLADYMQIDITIIKVLFVLATIFLAGTGLLVYIILWIVAPVNPDPTVRFKKFNDYFEKNQQNASMFNSPNAFSNPSNTGEQTKWNTENVGPDFSNPNPADFNPVNKPNDTSRTISGLILLIVGLYLLLRYTLDVIPEWFSIWKVYKLWPLALVAVGVSLIFRNQRKSEWEKFKKTTAEAQQTENKPVEDVIVVDENKDSTTSNP
jgi:phage shock protein C